MLVAVSQEEESTYDKHSTRPCNHFTFIRGIVPTDIKNSFKELET